MRGVLLRKARNANGKAKATQVQQLFTKDAVGILLLRFAFCLVPSVTESR
jgi:hypothetical protein